MDHLITHFPAGYVTTDCLHNAGALTTGYKRQIGLHLIFTLNNQHVRKIESRRLYPDQYIRGADFRCWPVRHQI